jgi:hypothetical protein
MQAMSDSPRATRYDMSAPFLYRCAGEATWLAGRTVNVSRTGVLFRSVLPAVPAPTRIEFVLMLPSLGLPGRSLVQCQGRIVRCCASSDAGECGIAATIDAYEFLGIVPESAEPGVMEPVVGSGSRKWQ